MDDRIASTRPIESKVTNVRIALKIGALALITGIAAAVLLVLRLVTLGARGPGLRAGAVCCLWWSRMALRVIGLKVRIEGRPGQGRFMVAANHLSYLDIWLLGSLFPTVFVAKREIASWPLFGPIARASGTVFVDRESARDLLRASRRIDRCLDRGVSLTLFAEGMATDGKQVLPFMPSLFEPAARRRLPCYGASITYDSIGDGPPSETVCWSGSQRFGPHLRRLLAQPRIEATVRLHSEPVVSADRKTLARDLHRLVAASFEPVRRGPGQSRGMSQSSAPK